VTGQAKRGQKSLPLERCLNDQGVYAHCDDHSRARRLFITALHCILLSRRKKEKEKQGRVAPKKRGVEKSAKESAGGLEIDAYEQFHDMHVHPMGNTQLNGVYLAQN
jgi:hypothetical protein